ncbi:Probable malonyl-CoA-acyl carrier protein transacylase, mitochondrial [Eumeta japonica]|uniref:Probable malonyl-CoA-acyl carrier protein transacylase, mitochondrial n=1 Tax=Eumeta variegata TaxID=151549 RepID=A0A4C1WDG0_EUMVA|nr:Probable malonyl-CoA-acyl carrier protein transacylase, mitochondrial [Eumeta japonica]
MSAESSNLSNIEHRAVIKYFVKKGKTPKEIFEDMVSVLQESAPSYTMVKKWARLFQQGRESCKDDPRPGRPVTVVTEENVRKIEKLVLADRRIKLWQIAEEMQISKERIGEIIHEHMNMRKISARWVPKMLTPFDKQRRLQTSKDFFKLVGDNIEEICDRIVTVDETWVRQYDPESKQESMQWTKKDRRRNSSRTEATWEVIARSAVLHNASTEDNASVHTARVSRQALKDTGFSEIDHPPYSPDLALRWIEREGRAWGIRRSTRVLASGAFHTEAMRGAVEAVRAALALCEVRTPNLAVWSSVDAKLYHNAAQVRARLPRQVVAPVRWEQTLHAMFARDASHGFPLTCAVGPGRSMRATLRQVNAKAWDSSVQVDT